MFARAKACLHDSPLYRLTRHFFAALFDLGFLSDAGAEGFERLIIGICAVFVSFGLLLVRIFMGQYRYLSSLPTPEPFREALLGGDSFVMAVPMWIVAFVTVLVSHALFPDETDFRVLMPLPIEKRLVFGAKLLALALFAAVFIGSAHVALTPLIVLLSIGRWMEHTAVAHMAAFAVASLGASVFAVLVVTAANGLLILLASRGQMMSISAALRSLLLALLVLALPFLGRLTARGPEFSAHSGSLYFSPPAWFVGVEQLLLGHLTRQFLGLAAAAAIGIGVTLLITVGTYTMLYRHFERVTRRPAGGSPDAPASAANRLSIGRGNAQAAIRSFVAITLRRSALHQGVVVFVAAIGFGIVINTLIGIDTTGLNGSGTPSGGTIAAVVWAPFVLILFASLAARSALTLPIEQRANWVFRMTEESSVRVQALRASVGAVRRLGIALPVLVSLPLHWLAFGPFAVVTMSMTGLCGLLLVEVLMKDWSRIPFTCTYVPGKRFLPQSLLIGFATFLFFTGIGAGVVAVSLRSPTSGAVPALIISVAVLAFRYRRLAMWKDHPLMFDDALPSEVNPLRLSMD